MGRRRSDKESIRSIQKTNGSYLVSLPIELIRQLKWQEHQRVVITKSGNKLVIGDYEE